MFKESSVWRNSGNGILKLLMEDFLKFSGALNFYEKVINNKLEMDSGSGWYYSMVPSHGPQRLRLGEIDGEGMNWATEDTVCRG